MKLCLSTSNCKNFTFLFFIPVFISTGRACIPTRYPAYGDTTPDYNIQVGSDLIIDCTLYEGPLLQTGIPANSSYLAFKKDGQDSYFTTNTVPVNSTTARLEIPNAKVEDSGLYHCWILFPERNEHVCLTTVNVGYPPQNVSNFKCISRNFDNLTCSWDVEPNQIPTNYTLTKEVFDIFYQDCPQPNNKTFCQWRDNTDPPYVTVERNSKFFIHGNNSLGSIVNVFEFDQFEIVIPNQPEEFKTVEISKNSVSLKWNPPTMTRILVKPELFYQLWLQELGPDSEDKIVIEAGPETFKYTFNNLLPHYTYNVSVRCRVGMTKNDDMWSPFVSIVFRTNADIPYVIPEVNPLGFVIHNYGIYRNTTLYWKPVSERFHNGEEFHYRIEYSELKEHGTASYVISETPFVKVGHLHNDTAYAFKIHSANSEGISKSFKEIVIDERDKILPSVKDIRAISSGIRHYNLSWSKSDSPHSPLNYTVFWCSSRKPGLCEGPIQWTEVIVGNNGFSLNVSNVDDNFQFGVAAVRGNRSSGVQWASCVVPQKAPLGQIPITHIEPHPNMLQVRWKLDCDAQKSVINRYIITYCREGANCKDAVVKSDALGFQLENLQPYSNYSIKLRAFNKENKPSEDTDEMYQRTLSARPSDPPHNITITSSTDSSFTLTWAPPNSPNGIITHYFVHINNERKPFNDSTCKKCRFEVVGLKVFTVYNVSVEACVGNECSPRSVPVSVQTEVGAPGKMHPPIIEKLNRTHLKLSWSDPFPPNGPIEKFEIQWLQLGTDNQSESRISRSRSTIVEVDCPILPEDGFDYQFTVRAGNVKDGTDIFGPFSDPVKEKACVMSQGLAMIIGIAIGGTFAFAIFLLFLYKLGKWMGEKIHQVKNIAVRLPKELEGPGTNPLNSYESFKNGLVPSIHIGKHPPSYILDDNENKNRHGSGSSQFSNISTDELIFKNGKCTKFGRKPSSDSSGCSSLTSNTTANRMQLSSDSGTESDFVNPSASPDSEKPQMPILMEIRDSLGVNTALDKYNSFVSGIADHPYSKFGISGSVTSSIPCQINPLVFYSRHLANSEPSVVEAQAGNGVKTARPLYSKVGYAKSSGDILGMNKEFGYSKFGLVSIDAERLNPVVGMAIEMHDIQNGQFGRSKDLPNDSKILVGNSQRHPSKESGSCIKEHVPMLNKSSSGYVQVGDMRNMTEMDNISVSTSSSEEDSSPLQIPADLANELSDLSSVWTTGLLQFPAMDIAGDACSPSHSGPTNQLNGCPNRPNSVPSHLYDPNYLHGGPNQLNRRPNQPNGGSTFPSSVPPKTDSFRFLPPDNLDPSFRVQVQEQRQNPFQDKTTSLSWKSQDITYAGDRPTSKLPEVLLRPGPGYVPLSVLCSSSVPNPLPENYVTPSNKGEMRLLREGFNARATKLQANSTGCPPSCNGTGTPGVRHVLRTLPRMESEICEV